MKIKRIILNTNLGGYKKGKELIFSNDGSGLQLDAYWCRRIEDSKIDGCVEILEEDTKAPKKSRQKKDSNSAKPSAEKKTLKVVKKTHNPKDLKERRDRLKALREKRAKERLKRRKEMAAKREQQKECKQLML